MGAQWLPYPRQNRLIRLLQAYGIGLLSLALRGAAHARKDRG